MELTNFIQQLLTEGSVSIQEVLISFDEKDEAAAAKLLHQYYEEDRLEMPLTAPAFNDRAAVWAARYFYNAVQLTVLRDEEEAAIHSKLAPFTETINPSAMYSVDLVFRYLPGLLHLAKGVAPADVLVKILTQTLAAWSFSSAGAEVTDVKNEEIIFADPSLKTAYLDRLIFAKDAKRIISSQLQEDVFSLAGIHLNTLWPQASIILKTNH